MGYAVNEKCINLEDVGFELRTVESLLEIMHEHYFGHHAEAVEKAPGLIVCEYERYSNVLYVSLNALRDARKTLDIARQNCERETVPYYGDLGEENKAYINGQIALLIKEQRAPLDGAAESTDQKIQ